MTASIQDWVHIIQVIEINHHDMNGGDYNSDDILDNVQIFQDYCHVPFIYLNGRIHCCDIESDESMFELSGPTYFWLSADGEEKLNMILGSKKVVKRYTDWIRAVWFQEIQEEQEARAKAESNNGE